MKEEAIATSPLSPRKSPEDPEVIICQSGDDASLTSIEHSQSYFQIWFAKHKQRLLQCFYVLVLIAIITIGLVYGLRRQDIERPDELYPTSGIELPYIGSRSSSSILNGYDVCSDLKDDLEAAARYIIDVEIDKNAKRKFHEDWAYWGWVRRGGDISIALEEDGLVEFASEDQKGSDQSGSVGGGGGGEDSYGTNNQVDGVDEADLIKSDGEVVYAAYGNQIVIWNATSGAELSRTTLPTEDHNNIPLCTNDENAQKDIVRKKCYMDFSWRSDGLTISSLLMHEERLVVIATAMYDLLEIEDQDSTEDIVDEKVASTGSSTGASAYSYSVLDGYHRTRVFTYDISSLPDDKSALTLLARKDLQGSYQTARSIGQEAHIVTRAYVQTWSGLEKYIDPWNERFEGLKENQFRQAAYDAVEPHIPKFAETLTAEIMYSHGRSLETMSESNCNMIAKVALMLQKRDGDTTADASTKPLSFTDEGVLRDYVQVHSFDILESFDGNDETKETQLISTSHSGIFIPTARYTSAIYSSETKLIITGNAYTENEDKQWVERTILLAFDLKGGTAVAHSVGEVPGSVLNQFSIDHHNYGDDDDKDDDDYIRIATTTWAQFGIVNGEWSQTVESTNQVLIVKLPTNETDSTNMEIVGQATDMGVGERIYSARFVGKVGYVVTFRQIDPFYTLNLTDPSNPEVVGELKIPGFSNYLHPVNDDLILALGQDANDEGVVQGLQIAMFNVSDFANPVQTHKYVESGGYSSSESQYDHKAFRYLPESKLLIIPMSMYSFNYEDSFDGFVVYDVDETKKFTKSFNISHDDESVDYCWSRSNLPSRSLVFDGKVTTTKGHTALSHDLESFQKRWALNLDEGREKDKGGCYNWWGYFK